MRTISHLCPGIGSDFPCPLIGSDSGYLTLATAETIMAMAPGLITAATRIYQIKIELTEVRPTIWRRVLVPDAMTLDELHDVVQGAMGWQDSHLHEFEVDGLRFGVPDPEEDEDDEFFDDAGATLGLVADEGSVMFYLYDFGDCWSHTLTVEASIGSRVRRCGIRDAWPAPDPARLRTSAA